MVIFPHRISYILIRPLCSPLRSSLSSDQGAPGSNSGSAVELFSTEELFHGMYGLGDHLVGLGVSVPFPALPLNVD